MSISAMPEKIINYNVYVDGSKEIGIGAETKLPSLESLTETITGAGIAGEFESSTPGHFKAMNIEIPFRVPNGQAFLLANYNLSNITLRAAVQNWDAGLGQTLEEGLKIVLNGQFKILNPGSLGVAKPADCTVQMEVLYYRIDYIDYQGNVTNLCEIDKLNFKCILNGVDVLGPISQFL